MKNSQIMMAALLACVLSFFGGRYFSPKVESVKESIKSDEQKRTDTTRTIDKKETILPDGTKIIETKSETKKRTDSSVNIDASKESKTESRPDYRLGVIYFPEVPGFQDQNAVVDIQKRIIGEIYLGISASTQKQIGLSISIGF